MRSFKPLLRLIIITLVLPWAVFAQTPSGAAHSFGKDGLYFDYPGGWTVTDKSTERAQYLVISRPGSSVLILIIGQRGLTRRNELAAAQQEVTEPLVKELSLKLARSSKPERTSVQTDAAGLKANGIRLHVSSKKASKAEIYSLRQSLRFINLVFLRADKDELQGTPAWEKIRSTLKVDPPVIGVMAVPKESSDASQRIEDGVLNGRANELPHPTYPAIAKAAHASGTVVVQVIIDEMGAVISARAISGHPLLQAVSVEAARKARFSPTSLDGEPVRVAGVITYNFVASR